MTRKEKKDLRQRQTTRQLMGIQQITPHGIITSSGALTFFLIHPDNLSVLSVEGIRARVKALSDLFRGESELAILALDSRESFQHNKDFYQGRLEREKSIPSIRALLARDMAHLDEIQAEYATAREFVLILRSGEQEGADENSLRQKEKGLCDHGIQVRLAEEQDVKRLLSVYYQRDMTTDYFVSVDGEMEVFKCDK